MFENPNYKITENDQLKELTNRVPPILNVDVIVYRTKPTNLYTEIQYLIGKRNPAKESRPVWLFPGGRVKFNETPQDAGNRLLENELPEVTARLKKIAAVTSDKGFDHRAYGVTIYFLYEYQVGEPKSNDSFIDFAWHQSEDIRKLKDVFPIDVSILNELDSTVRTINTSEDEILVEMDKDNNEIGTIIKREAHSNPNKFHRSAHMIIFNSKGEIILQKRSLNKSTGAGKWDIHGGHQAAGQTIEQTAKHELIEELGIETHLTFKETRLFRDDKQSEWIHVFYGQHDGPYGYDKNEVDAIKAFDCQKLLEGKYDYDHDLIFHVKQYVQEFKPVWENIVKKIKP